MASKVQIVVGALPDKENVKLISLIGEIDETNLGELKEVVDPLLISNDCQVLLVNLKDLNFINSMVISYFTNIYTKLTELNKKVVFIEANNQILDILDLVGLTTIIDNYNSLSEALSALD
jgi:anti-anti-sigma factor